MLVLSRGGVLAAVGALALAGANDAAREAPVGQSLGHRVAVGGGLVGIGDGHGASPLFVTRSIQGWAVVSRGFYGHSAAIRSRLLMGAGSEARGRRQRSNVDAIGGQTVADGQDCIVDVLQCDTLYRNPFTRTNDRSQLDERVPASSAG